MGRLQMRVKLLPFLDLLGGFGQGRCHLQGHQLGGQGRTHVEDKGALMEAEQVKEGLINHFTENTATLFWSNQMIFQQLPETAIFWGVRGFKGGALNLVDEVIELVVAQILP